MLNVNTNLYTAQGIDVNSVAKVSSQILSESASKQATVQAIDYSKFNRATLGIDLYSSRTNAQLQKQIAMTQAGLYAQAIDVAKLNSQAAANLYSAATVQKNVEMTQSTQAIELVTPNKIEDNSRRVQLFNISDKNSNSSNGFNPFKAEEETTTKEESEKESFNLFA